MKSALFDDTRLLATILGLLVVAGITSMLTIVRQEDPTITNGIAVITTPLPGASAERVEALVTEKVEDELRTLTEIQTLSSISANGVSVVTVEVDETITGDAVEPVFSKIRDAIDDARSELPAGALPPEFDNDRFGSFTRIEALVWAAQSPVRLGVLRRYAKELEDRFRDVRGTDVARTFGAPGEEIRVEFEPELLDGTGLTSSRLARSIALADSKVAAGLLRGSRHDVPIEVRGELSSLDRIRQIPVATAGRGRVLRVGDVARIERSVAEPAAELAFFDGRPAVLVAAQLAAGEKFDAWTTSAERMLSDFDAELPHGIERVTFFDQSRYTRARLADLVQSLATGLLIVVVVLFVTLGLRSAVIVSMTLPLVMLASIAVLRVGGVPIHQMSVTGLIVALGLLVDNAIVVTDSIRSRRLRGLDARAAVRESVARLWVPLTSSTLTTVLAFMPILLLPGRVGEFVGTIGLSVIIALVVSHALALTVVPAIAGRILQAGGGHGAGILTTGIRWPQLTAAFERSLDWSLRRPRTSMALAAVLPILGFVGASTLPRQFFPPADRDQFHVELRMRPSSSIAGTTEAVLAVDELLRSEPDVEAVTWVVGKSAPPFYYNMKQDKDRRSSFAQALVDARSVPAVKELLSRLPERVGREVPEAQVIMRELLQGPPVDAPIEYRIQGPDIEELRRLGDELRERLARVPVITHSTASLTAGSPKLWLEPDEAEARLAGVGLVELATQMNRYLEGVPAGSVLEATEELPVRVRVDSAGRGSVSAVGSIPVRSSIPEHRAGPGIPLDALGELELKPILDFIPHRDGTRVNIIRGYTRVGVYPETALTQLRTVLDDDPVEAPRGYHIETGGDAEERGDAMSNLFASVPVLALLMVATVALSLRSFRLGGVVLAVAVCSVGLGLASLSLLGHPLGFQAIIGLIGLVGVAINAAIIINASLRTDPRAIAGSPAAIRHVVTEETSRHIVSTTITTFGGFLPLILSSGGFWPPFATGIAGGVLLSTLVSFYFVPAAFLLITRRRPVERPRELSRATTAEVVP